MKKWNVLGILVVLSAGLAQAAGPALTYHGRILKADGTPLTASSVQFKIQFRSPGTENCLMYEETVTKDLSTTSGAFAIGINNGTGTRTDTSGYSLEQIFSNRTGFTFGAGVCSTGTAYTPASTDGRSLLVYFNDGTFAGWEPVPQQAVNLMPQAIESLQVGGFNASSLLRVADGTGPQPATALTPANFTDLMALVNGTSNKYMENLATTPTTPVTGQVWYDRSANLIKYYDGTSTVTVGGGGGGGGSGTVTSVSGTAPISVATGTTTPVISITQAATGSNGYLSSTDWNTFNGKQAAGSYITALTGDVTAAGPGSAAASVDKIKGVALDMTGIASGNFLKYNGTAWVPASIPAGNAGTVTSVTGNGPISVATGTTTPAISISQAATGANGYLSSTDWNTFNNKLGAISNTASLANTKIWIGDAGGKAQEFPFTGDVSLTAGGVTKVTAIQNTPVSATGPATTGQVLRNVSGTWTPGFVSMFDLRSTVTGTATFGSGSTGCTAGQTLTWTAATDNLACTNIAIADSQITYATKTANTVLAGPTSGGAAAPTFRALVAADIPAGIASQWTTSSSDIYYTAGKVGIGTTSPGNPLHIVNTTDITNFLVEAQGVSSNSAFELVAPLSSAVTNGKAFSIRANSEGFARAMFYTDGKIGFGSGSVTRDTFISRAGTNTLRLSSDGGSGSANLIVNGNVGIGSTGPRANLDVAGTIVSKAAVSNATTTVDFSTGNIQYTTSNCGAFQFDNLKDGGSYTFVVQGATAATCTFTGYSGASTGAITVHMPPDNGNTVASKHTMYNILVVGTHAYVAWTPGY